MSKYTPIRVREYSQLETLDLRGYDAVVWTHPDIPMYGAELFVEDDGTFVVGNTLNEKTIKGE